MTSPNHILLFDADCILCNKSVQFVIKNDRKKIFHFASLQSEFGQAFLKQYNFPENVYSTVIYCQNDQVFTKSSAAIRAFASLGTFSKPLLIFLCIPRPLRDYVYDLIAKNRKRFFKNQSACLIPTEELKKRML